MTSTARNLFDRYVAFSRDQLESQQRAALVLATRARAAATSKLYRAVISDIQFVLDNRAD